MTENKRYTIDENGRMVLFLKKEDVEHYYNGLKRALNNEDLEEYPAIHQLYEIFANGFIDLMKAAQAAKPVFTICSRCRIEKSSASYTYSKTLCDSCFFELYKDEDMTPR
jgi:formylmethanofuran dehydrogenase subunit E